MTQWVETSTKAPADRSQQVQALLALAAARRADDAVVQRRFAEALTRSADAQAWRAWQRVVELNADDGPAWLELGRLLFDAGRLTEAVSAFGKACKLRPDLASCHVMLARALRVLGDEAAADTAFDRAIALAPDHPLCIRTVGRRLARSGRGAELAQHCQTAAQRFGWSVGLLDHLAIAEALQGRRAEVAAMIDYGLVSRQSIEVPPAPFETMSSFNAALAQELREHPRLRPNAEGSKEFIDGNLAFGMLDGNQHAIAIAALGGLVKQAYAHYCEATASRGHHAFRHAMPSRARISVNGHITRQEGYIRPHTHSGSWLVAVYYVAVKPATEPDLHGWLEFGSPTHLVQLPDGVWPHHVVRPTPGTLLLFPGYYPHWTWPSRLAEERIVCSFDIMPATT